MSALTTQEQESLRILANAINDTGFWCYWQANAPFSFQAEFNWVQLWNETLREPITKPSSQVALRFDGIRSFEFLSFADPTSEIPENWAELMSQDKLPLANGVLVIFNDQAAIEKELLNCKRRTSPFGSWYVQGADFYQTTFQCLVIGGDVGFLIGATTLHWIDGQGIERSFTAVPAASTQWWNYWKTYWDRREKDGALPYDPACEVTIPLS